MEKNILFPWAVGQNIKSREDEKGIGNLGKKIMIKKIGEGKNIKLSETIYAPDLNRQKYIFLH